MRLVRAHPVTLLLRRSRIDDPPALALIERVQAEYVVRYGGPDESPMDPEGFLPPAGDFFLGWLDDVPVAMGGWRLRPDVRALGGSTAAELKRMYVVDDYRRRGISRLVLARLEESARESGADLVVLETGIMQPEALALYGSSGYTAIPGFGFYKDEPESRYLGRRL